ncbi:MAG: GNAT family N-acetyltransferase [Candidatus Odinarchaeia archaeon]
MVKIEHLETDQFELLAEWLSNPKINCWLTSEWRNRTVTRVLIAIAVRNPSNKWFLTRYNNKPCGLVALADLDTLDRTAMVWALLGESVLGGKGITSEALKLLISYSFDHLGLASLYAWVMDGNIASLRMFEKAGFRRAGRIRSAACFDGKQVDRIYFDIIKTDSSEI